jgi:hypothetical protein
LTQDNAAGYGPDAQENARMKIVLVPLTGPKTLFFFGFPRSRG